MLKDSIQTRHWNLRTRAATVNNFSQHSQRSVLEYRKLLSCLTSPLFYLIYHHAFPRVPNAWFPSTAFKERACISVDVLAQPPLSLLRCYILRGSQPQPWFVRISDFQFSFCNHSLNIHLPQLIFWLKTFSAWIRRLLNCTELAKQGINLLN